MANDCDIHGDCERIYLSGERITLNISANSHKCMLLNMKNGANGLRCTASENSNVKIFTKITELRDCQLNLEFDLHENSELEVACFVENCQNLRLSQEVNLLGEHSRARICNACMASGCERINAVTTQTHLAPESESSIATHLMLDGYAMGNIVGTINVLESAQRSESAQYTKSILLSDCAEITVAPNLNIMASDVGCRHGAASGSLDGEALVYAQARGIELAQSKKMLANGFLLAVFADLGHAFWQRCFGSFLVENS
jgi:hypothetical protein